MVKVGSSTFQIHLFFSNVSTIKRTSYLVAVIELMWRRDPIRRAIQEVARTSTPLMSTCKLYN